MANRKVEIAANQRGVTLPNGKVFRGGEQAVLDADDWLTVQSLVTKGVLLDLGITAESPTPGDDDDDGGGGGGGVAAPRVRETVEITHTLALNEKVTGTVDLGPAYRILMVETTRPVRLRLYASDAHRTADLNRPLGARPAGDHGLQMEIVTTGAIPSLVMSPVVDGFDAGPEPDGQIPYHLSNLGPAGTATITLTFIRTE